MKKKLEQIKETPEEPGEFASKSQAKREMHALQALGERLTELSFDHLKNIEMPDDLLQAVLFAKSMTKHGARRRQFQHIGKIMREIDPLPIKNALESIDQGRQGNVLLFKQAESLREAVLEGSDEVLKDIQARFQDADIKKLGQFAKNAKEETAKGRHGRYSRSLFRYLMELLKAGEMESGVK